MIIVKDLQAATLGQTPVSDQAQPIIYLELPYDLRKKSRLLATSTCGQEVGIQLPRGNELFDGQRLQADTGQCIEIVASKETLSTVSSESSLALLKAAYHLGNRHVPLHVTEQWLRYQHDHVLDGMVQGLGLHVTVEQAPFQPESGAYGNHTGHGHHDH